MKKFVRRSFGFGTCLTAVVYLISCLTPYINPEYFSLLTYSELAFPYVAVVMILLIIIWIFIRRKTVFILLLLLFMGYKNLTATFALNFNSPGTEVSSKPQLRILSWNVRGFENPSYFVDSPKSLRRQMFNYIRNSNADILCLQEFTEHTGAGMFSNTQDLVNLGYKYYLKTADVTRIYPYGIIVSSSAIFSKIPLQDTGKVVLGDSSFPEHMGFADVRFGKRFIRVFTAHFKSLNLHAEYTDSVSIVPFHGDSNFLYRASWLEKIKVFSCEHARQAQIAKEQLAKSPYPLIFCGDLNSVPTSYAYHTIARDLQDAFLTMSSGFGTTFYTMPVKLRIDYLLLDKRIKLQTYQRDEVQISDHYPQLIGVMWK